MTAARSLRRLAVVLALAAPMGTALAQAPTVPPPTCARPTLPAPDQPITDAEAAKVNTTSKAYTECLTSYHNARKAVVDESNATIARATATGQANAEAANKAREEMNSFMTTLNANIAAHNKARQEGKFD